MATTTPNFGWPVPTSTDLVKDGATAMEALGDAIDTSMVDLKGGTTGQVLAKASNTDMDFSWVAQDDSNAIQNTIVDAKGDLIAASAADTPARLAVGTNGQVLTADSTAATGLAWATPSGGSNTFYAGKNKLINGDFGVNQRSFTSVTSTNGFTFDRFQVLSGGTATTYNFTPQTFTPGTAPVAGYEGKNYLQCAITTSTGAYIVVGQRIEDVRTFAGQTITVSLWAKAASGTPSIDVVAAQTFGGGGSSDINIIGTKQAITTSWARYSFTLNIPSISGKTIGTNSNLLIYVAFTDALIGTGIGDQTGTFSIWGFQAEAGSTATDFVTASGNSPQGELAMCQRYYWRTSNSGVNNANLGGTGFSYSTSAGAYWFTNPVSMRTVPSAFDAANLRVYDITGAAAYTATGTISTDSTPLNGVINFAVSGITANRIVRLDANTTGGYVGFSAEL